MEFSDEELMQKIKNSDMYAFDDLVRRWEYRLFNLVFKVVGDPETAKDICQEVFLRVYQTAKRYRSVGQFETWIYRIAINCSINELKKRKRQQMFFMTMPHGDRDGSYQTLENALSDPKQQPDEVVQQDEIAKHIQDALDRLPSEQRIVIILRHYEGLKFQQIASILDCPLGTVKSRMYAGLEQLKTMLRRYL